MTFLPPISCARWLAVALTATMALSACSDEDGVSGDKADVTTSVDSGATGDIGADVSTAQDTTQADIKVPSIIVNAVGAKTGPRVTIDATVADDDAITVRILVRDFADLYAIAAHLTWDPKALKLVTHQGHLMMLEGDYNSRTLAKPSGSGLLLLGAARFLDGGSPWTPISGAKVGAQQWATLTFKMLTNTAELTFDPDHSLAKSADYESIAVGWQQLTLKRTVATGGGL